MYTLCFVFWFRFLVSFSRKTKPKTKDQRKRNHQTTPEIKTRAPQNCARVLSPAFYLLQGHKPGTGKAARVLYDRFLVNLVNAVIKLNTYNSRRVYKRDKGLLVVTHSDRIPYAWDPS